MYEQFERLLNMSGFRAADVAKATGIKPAILSSWKNGNSTPRAESLQKIAEFFHVPLGYFFGEDEQPVPVKIDTYAAFVSLLDKYNISPADVSRGTGLPTSLFTEWKKGKSSPKLDKLQKIATYFDVPVSYFITGETTSAEEPQTSVDKDIEKQLQKTLDSLENDSSLLFDGKALDETTKVLLRQSLEMTLVNARMMAKNKYTPDKYKK